MTYKTMKIEDIIKWCQENNQIEWLKAESEKMVDFVIYPDKLDSNGLPLKRTYVGKDGKTHTKTIKDEKAKPTIQKNRITVMQIKQNFCAKFMPELLPAKKEKKKTFYDFKTD